jgi:IS66 C-terminal element/Transposase IS66 family
MAGKSKITIATLVNLGAPKLAALLLAEAAGNKQLKQAIELAISAKKGPEILAANVRKRLASFGKSRSMPSYERGREIIAEHGRLCISNNAAERALRGIAVGRHNWTFAGSDEGGRRAAAIYTLIETAKLNDIDPQAWLADVLARLPDHPAKRINALLPWNWRQARQQIAMAA